MAKWTNESVLKTIEHFNKVSIFLYEYKKPFVTRSDVAYLVATLFDLAKKHSYACERYCNDERYTDKFEKASQRLRDKMVALLAEYVTDSWRLEFQNDPRGYTVKLAYYTENKSDENIIGLDFSA